jgi:hypothetical protein
MTTVYRVTYNYAWTMYVEANDKLDAEEMANDTPISGADLIEYGHVSTEVEED